MGNRAGYGFQFGDGGTGIGVIPFAIRSTDSLPAIFTSEALRDAYYVTNPGDIAAGTDLANREAAVGIGPVDGDPTGGVTIAYIRNEANDAWVAIATNFVGPIGPQGDPGPTGPAGADGVRRMFGSIAERDAFYATQPNRDDLMTDDVISVNVGTNLVEFQRWLGADAPTTYDPNNFSPTSIRTANASINFGDELRIFDYGEFVGFEDMINNVTALAIGQRYDDLTGSETAQQLNFPAEGVLSVTTGSTTSALQAVHEYTEDTTGFLTNPAIVLSNTINFVVAPNFYVLEIFIGTDATGTRIFRERFEPPGAGVYTQRPDSPQRFLPNTTYFLRFTGDVPFSFIVGDQMGDIAAVGTTTGFEFTQESLATENYANQNLAGLDAAIEMTANVSITDANKATYERKLLYTPMAVTSDLTITIDEGIDFHGFAVAVFGSGSVTPTVSGSDTIQGGSSITFVQYEGGRILQLPGSDTVYNVVYANRVTSTEAIQDIVGAMVTGNTETRIQVTYDDASGKLNFVVDALTVQNEGVSLAAAANTLNFTGAGVTASGTGATKTITIPGGGTGNDPFDQVFDYNPTGNQDLGVDIAGDIHQFGVNTTSVTILDGTAITSLRWFAFTIEGTVDVTFDLATSGFQFDGIASGTTYTVPRSATTLFYVIDSFIYPISSTATGGAVGTDHPVTLIRDTPTLVQLAALAAASVNTNTGLWITSANQIQATEDLVDPTIMIRALSTGLLDANNSVLSTDAVEKRTVVLQAGTVVRVFSSTDLRVVSTPTVRESAARYPDLANLTASPLNIVGNQAVYNLHRNRTTVLTDSATTGTSTWEVRLPSLQNVFDLMYLDRNDVFGFRNDRTDSLVFRIRAFQVGTSFSDGSGQVDIAPGQTLFTSPAPSGNVWEILQFGQSTTLPTEAIALNTDWYRDGTDSTAVDNAVRLHHRKNIVDGLVRDHIASAGFANNPISLLFEHRNLQDDIAWINWWSTFDGGVPPLSAGPVGLIEAEIPASLTYIETNITVGFDFQFNDPSILFSIVAITNDGGDSFRIEVDTALPAYIVVNDQIQINSAANPGNNGLFLIDTILVGRTIFTITNANGVNESGSGFIDRPIYADLVVISNPLRQANFNLYRDAARTILLDAAQVQDNWFDPANEGVDSVLAIGYNNDIETIGSQIAIQDDTEEFFLVKGGPRGSVLDFDNVTPNYVNLRTLPVNFEQINIRSDGVANYVIPEFPAQLLTGESRQYTLWADPTVPSLNDVSIVVGDNASRVVFDEGFEALDILPGTQHTIELYNNGNSNGVKLVTPISKTLESTNIFNPAQGADTAQIDPLQISIVDVIAATNEDINGRFFGVGAPVANQVQIRANADYIFTLSIDVLFNGVEPSGISFVPVTLMPIINAVDQPRLSDTVSLVFSRNGQSGAGAPKFVHTLSSTFEYQGSVNDTVAFDIRFGTFPAGYTAADIQVLDFSYQFTAQTGLN